MYDVIHSDLVKVKGGNVSIMETSRNRYSAMVSADEWL